MSMIFSPLKEDGPLKAGQYQINGVVFKDGTAPVTEVTVSADGGKSWTNASVDKPSSPFTWYKWKAKLAKGTHELMVRATERQVALNPWIARICGAREVANGMVWTG